MSKNMLAWIIVALLIGIPMILCGLSYTAGPSMLKGQDATEAAYGIQCLQQIGNCDAPPWYKTEHPTYVTPTVAPTPIPVYPQTLGGDIQSLFSAFFVVLLGMLVATIPVFVCRMFGLTMLETLMICVFGLGVLILPAWATSHFGWSIWVFVAIALVWIVVIAYIRKGIKKRDLEYFDQLQTERYLAIANKEFGTEYTPEELAKMVNMLPKRKK